MKKKLINLLLLAILSTCPALSQTVPVQDSLLEHMVGKWILKGTIAGQETTHDINVDWILGHQYIQIREVSREKDSNDKPSYDALVFVTREQKQNQYKCLWLDNTGNGGLSAQAFGLANRIGDKVEFIFTISDVSTFHTTFLYDRYSDSWQWLMDSRENNKALPFARVKLTRAQ